MEFSTTPTDDTPDEDTRPLVLDADEFTLHKPKQSLIFNFATSDTGSGMEQTRTGMALMYGCLDPPDRARLKERLDDPDDRLDMDFLIATVIPAVIGEFIAPPRPTGKPSASTRRRASTRKRSTGASPSTESTLAG